MPQGDLRPIARRVERVSASPSTMAAARARRLKDEGRDVLDLTVGEPDFDTPEHVKQAAIEAIWRGETKYTPVNGTAGLRAAITNSFERRTGISFGADRIVVGGGAKQIIFLAMMATLEPGDEVVIPAPYWVSYPDMVELNGGIPVVLPCNEADEFRLDAGRLAAVVNARTRWVVLNTPANPTGTVYSEQELLALGAVVRANPRLSILLDEIYHEICFRTDPPRQPLALDPDLADQMFVVNGVSKSYAMTGWRLGYGFAEPVLAAAVNKLQSQSSSCPSSVSQAAAAAALSGDQSFVQSALATYSHRRSAALGILGEVELLSCFPPDGAFYLFVNCADAMGRYTAGGEVIETDDDFVQYLLESYDVAVIAGSAYGASPYFRLSIATSETVLKEACRRIGEACAELR